MSRCFPFPPPGYVVNGIRDADVAMIDSIKGEEKKSKKEHKGKRDKKEKKEKKDKKDKKRKEREGESEKHSHKRRRKGEEVAKDVQNKLKESESVCLEKSSLTVERELVQSTSQNSCDSTLNSNEKEKQKVTLNVRHNNKNDSSLNSNELPKEKQPLNGRHNSNELLLKEKEKQLLNGRHNSNELLLKEKEKQLLDGRHNNNNNDSESIIRIRLPIRRPKDPEMTMMVTNKDHHQPCPSQDIKLDSVAREQPQHPCSTSAPEQVSKRKDHTSKTKHKEKKLSSTAREALQFLNIVENWVPTTIESRVELTNSEDDECWWLVKKPSSNKIDTERSKQLNRNNETRQQVMSNTWPRASLLPEADVYALPYTVPF
ncbi:unnamed protein product [Eruca vesicaria subsp. sativa]|uniref:Myb-like protein X n=1 Tax=Eruca vesicaria subsp. sativa TaxID=29727 RepID=A0ABC8JK36_ERUVS|nr:unnamed protein product [Eruca vesicaria subsp. sativa]